MLEYPPPPCPVDDTPFTACCTVHYSVDAAGRIHPGRGGIVIVQLPARDAAVAAPAAIQAVEAGAPPVPLAAPSLPTTGRRSRRP
jgi:hypothetical protein